MKVLSTLAVFLCAVVSMTAQEISFSTLCETVEFCTDVDDCGPVNLNLFGEAATTCGSGIVEISYAIDLYDNGIIDNTGVGNIINGTYPVGTHRIIFSATDDCDNEEICNYQFLVLDCTPPVVWADSFMTGETMEDCMFELLATEVDNGSSDNCGMETMLIMSPSQGVGQTEPPSEASESWSFDACTDLGTNTIDLWISDGAGNWSYGVGYILVQDNQAPFCSCPPPIICLGSETEDNESIGEVAYLIEEGDPWNIEYTVYGNECVEYSLQSITTITPEKSGPHINGVSTFDLILISRHLLGIQELDSPYKLIAADVNNSNSISTFDLIQIRRLLLGLISEFPNNTSWRFVDSDFDFPNPQNPWETPFLESVSFEDYLWYVEFTGIKVGDVNGTASPGLVSNSESEQRNDFDFKILNQTFEKGEIVNVDFYANDIAECFGFQFGLDYDIDFLRFEKINNGSLKYLNEDNIGVKDEAGDLYISWTNESFDQLEKSEMSLFTFQFEALQNGTLHDVLKKSNTKLSSEAYTNKLNILDLNIQFLEVVPQPDLTLSIKPNPFLNETTIQFDLLKKEEVRLKILNTNGKLLKTIISNFEKGSNKIKLEENIFPTSGIYFYQIETSENIKTGKLLKM